MEWKKQILNEHKIDIILMNRILKSKIINKGTVEVISSDPPYMGSPIHNGTL